MKFNKLFALMLAFSLTVVAGSSVFAQDEEEMTEEEWQMQMDELTVRKNDLTSTLNSLNSDIDGLRKSSAQKDNELEKAENDLYASVGATKSQVADFRTKFNDLEKKINSKSGSKEDAEKTFAEIEASKIRCLPEFWDRFNAMKKKLDAWGPAPTNNYTVVKGDCLSKIAGMSKIYGNMKLWPALWEANKSGVVSAPPRIPKTIPNPNLIYPGQVLKVPTLTSQQKEETLKKKVNWRNWKRGTVKTERMKKTETPKKTETTN